MEAMGGGRRSCCDVGKLVRVLTRESNFSSALCFLRKWRSKAAAAQSFGKLLNWQEKLELHSLAVVQKSDKCS